MRENFPKRMGHSWWCLCWHELIFLWWWPRYLQYHASSDMKTIANDSDGLKAGPLEAILVIFGRRALIFVCLKALGKYKNDTTFVRMRSGDHFGNAKMSKRAPHSVEFNFFIHCDRQKRFSQNGRRRADLQKCASDFLIFALGLSYDLSKLSDDFTPFFRLWKTITKSLGKN